MGSQSLLNYNLNSNSNSTGLSSPQESSGANLSGPEVSTESPINNENNISDSNISDNTKEIKIIKDVVPEIPSPGSNKCDDDSNNNSMTNDSAYNENISNTIEEKPSNTPTDIQHR